MEISPGTGGGGSGSSLIVTDGITPVVNVSTIDFTSGATVTSGGLGIANVAVTGTVVTFVDNEIVSGSATSWTLAHVPKTGTQAVYANGQRLTPGTGQDYIISAANITTALSWSAGTILADYQF